MDRQYYLRISADDYYNKVKGFCEDNNVKVELRSELFSFAAEKAIDNIEKEDNLELKNLFSKVEDSEYEYDTLCEEVENSIMSILDDNFDKIKDTFYKRLEVREIYKRENENE